MNGVLLAELDNLYLIHHVDMANTLVIGNNML